MKVIEFPKNDPQTLENFLSEIKQGETRPGIYIGFTKEGNLVIHRMPMSWAELAHIKTSFEMNAIRDWLGLTNKDEP